MIRYFTRWRTRRILARHPITEPAWRYAQARCMPAQRLPATEQARLRVLATLFLHHKALEPVRGVVLDDGMRALLAAHACLPVLHLGLGWYRSWHALVIYPGLFVPEREYVDQAGVVHHTHAVLEGEAWERGPVILSWEAVMQSGSPAGHNVVIHEMAHKLDMLNGAANGFPPLHASMDRLAWSQAFADAWRRLERARRAGHPVLMDPYGLENPGEFFAVASEVFFEQPAALLELSPDLYRQLTLFYRQQPIPA